MAVVALQHQIQKQYSFCYRYWNSQGCWWCFSGFLLLTVLQQGWNDDNDGKWQRLVIKVRSSVTSKYCTCAPFFDN
jgi:hypothetical protein